MAGVIIGEDTDDSRMYYKVKVRKGWFRGRDVFTERLHWYETELIDHESVLMPLNAGNMIYTMMQRLETGVEWERQASLMRSYRNLVYRLSYTTVQWNRDDADYLTFEGQKSDVMWTLSFISQVFFEDPMTCMSVPLMSGENPIPFAIQNGEYVGRNAAIISAENEMPDIWAEDAEDVAQSEMVYDPSVQPESGELFAIPDGRIAQYMRMDERFLTAKEKGAKCGVMARHNITASLIKDFEDMVSAQTEASYDVYQLRYSAFMNKTHELEAGIGGFEPTAYDVLPIAERGLPPASPATIERTNRMDANSLKYLYDSLKDGDLSKAEKKSMGKDIIASVRSRQSGYETEYRTYTATGTSEDVAAGIFQGNMYGLYSDFAAIDVLKMFKFPPDLYASLCNVPKARTSATEWERQRLQKFGKGYLDFLDMRAGVTKNRRMAQVWREARRLLNERYFSAHL